MNIKISYIISLLVLYILVIILPIIFYIIKVEKKDVLEYLKLKGNIKNGIFIGIISSGIFTLMVFIKNKILGINGFRTDIGMLWICGILVGAIEEIPFRGFLLEKFKERAGFWKSNCLVTIIFILVHFPNWIVNGTDILSSAITISLVSLCLGYLVNEYNSLWITIICHSVFNIVFWMT